MLTTPKRSMGFEPMSFEVHQVGLEPTTFSLKVRSSCFAAYQLGATGAFTTISIYVDNVLPTELS